VPHKIRAGRNTRQMVELWALARANRAGLPRVMGCVGYSRQPINASHHGIQTGFSMIKSLRPYCSDD
jgi:hypothetical protein